MTFYIIDDGMDDQTITFYAVYSDERKAKKYQAYLTTKHNIPTRIRTLEGFAGVVITMRPPILSGVN